MRLDEAIGILAARAELEPPPVADDHDLRAARSLGKGRRAWRGRVYVRHPDCPGWLRTDEEAPDPPTEERAPEPTADRRAEGTDRGPILVSHPATGDPVSVAGRPGAWSLILADGRRLEFVGGFAADGPDLWRVAEVRGVPMVYWACPQWHAAASRA